MMGSTLAGMIIGHYIGDFLLQNDWMASGKKLFVVPCAVHCLLWTTCVMGCGGLWNLYLFAWLFITHFLIDSSNVVSWWMNNVSGQGCFAKDLWGRISVDGAVHLLTILIGYRVVEFVG